MSNETTQKSVTRAGAAQAAPAGKGSGPSALWRKKENLAGYVFAGPAILGLIFFAFIPIAISFAASFSNWDMRSAWEFVGFSNYQSLFTEDVYFYRSLEATFYFAVLSVVASNLTALVIALLLNLDIKGQGIFRTVYYMPTIVPAVAQALLWGWLFNVDYGFFNSILQMVGLPPCDWLAGETTVIPSLVLMSVWACGGTMVIYLSGLQSVPNNLKEAVAIDGGGAWAKFRAVTVPYLSPIIFFNTLMSIIGSLQVFTQAMLMTGGGPNGRSLFYSYYLYLKAFRDQQMGYACAMAWVLFVIVVLISLLVFRFFKNRLYYESGDN